MLPSQRALVTDEGCFSDLRSGHRLSAEPFSYVSVSEETGDEQWQLVLTLELSSSQLPAGFLQPIRGATFCPMLSPPREGTKVRGYLLPNTQIWSEAKLSSVASFLEGHKAHLPVSSSEVLYDILSPTSELKEPLLTIIKY